MFPVSIAQSNTLINFRYNKKYKAEDGQNGSGSHRFGKSGEDIYIKVPLGTIVKDAETGKIVADLSEQGQLELVLKGGGMPAYFNDAVIIEGLKMLGFDDATETKYGDSRFLETETRYI